MVSRHAVGRGIRALGIGIQTRHLILPLIWGALFLVPFIMGSGILGDPVAITAMILLLQSSLAVSAPSTLFGRWKEDYYKEKLLELEQRNSVRSAPAAAAAVSVDSQKERRKERAARRQELSKDKKRFNG